MNVWQDTSWHRQPPKQRYRWTMVAGMWGWWHAEDIRDLPMHGSPGQALRYIGRLTAARVFVYANSVGVRNLR